VRNPKTALITYHFPATSTCEDSKSETFYVTVARWGSLSDGNHWLFGVLQNPEKNAVGFNTQRECFYTALDNSDLSLIEQITELLAVWVSSDLVLSQSFAHSVTQMAIPGNTLYDSFLKENNIITKQQLNLRLKSYTERLLVYCLGTEFIASWI
jgi:hypothetical protein